jgi:hypothetical protein
MGGWAIYGFTVCIIMVAGLIVLLILRACLPNKDDDFFDYKFSVKVCLKNSFFLQF